jgi:hypothetical protein
MSTRVGDRHSRVEAGARDAGRKGKDPDHTGNGLILVRGFGQQPGQRG